MAKDFTGGVDSLIGGKKKAARPEEKRRVEERREEAAPGDMTVATFKISKANLRKIRVLSALIEKEQKDILGEALDGYFAKYEKENGKIPA